jgi:hypothetical protein
MQNTSHNITVCSAKLSFAGAFIQKSLNIILIMSLTVWGVYVVTRNNIILVNAHLVMRS